MLLQRHGRVTVAQVASELEISPRTARRDLEALMIAGVPVYSARGRGGGWRLVGGATTNLTGLTGPEVRALFLAAGSIPGQPEEVTAALRKLQRAVPEPFRAEAAVAADAVFVDRERWWGGEAHPPPTFLDVLQHAVVDSAEIELGYLDRRGAPSRRRVHPLGLVDKVGVWYVVADTDRGRRTFRVDRIVGAEPTGRRLERPADFDLGGVWQSIVAELGQHRSTASVELMAEPWIIDVLRGQFGGRVVAVGPPDADGRHRVQIDGHTLWSLTGQLAGFGSAVEVVEPPEARRMLAETGRALVARYGDAGGPADPGDRQPSARLAR